MLDSEYSGKFRARKDRQLYARACYWYKKLFRFACHVFVLENAPETINIDYVDHMLMIRGSLIAQKPTETKGFPQGLYILDGAHEGIDPYNFPVNAGIINHAVTAPREKIGEGVFWLRSNSDACPVIDIINEYAEQLAMLDVGASTNILNTFTARVFRVKNEAQAQKVRKMYDNITAGEPATIERNSLLDDTNPETWCINNDTNYLVHDYLDDQDRIISRFLAEFGVESQPVEKKERNITPEFKVKLRELSIARAYWLDARNSDLEKINAYFGTNMRYSIREPDIEEMKSLDYQNGENEEEEEENDLDDQYSPRDTRPSDI